jgi:hypothetical protein
MYGHLCFSLSRNHYSIGAFTYIYVWLRILLHWSTWIELHYIKLRYRMRCRIIGSELWKYGSAVIVPGTQLHLFRCSKYRMTFSQVIWGYLLWISMFIIVVHTLIWLHHHWVSIYRVDTYTSICSDEWVQEVWTVLWPGASNSFPYVDYGLITDYCISIGYNEMVLLFS